MKAGKTAGRATAAEGADPAQAKRAAPQARKERHPTQQKKCAALAVNRDDALNVFIERLVRRQFHLRLKPLDNVGFDEDTDLIGCELDVEHGGEYLAFQVRQAARSISLLWLQAISA